MIRALAAASTTLAVGAVLSLTLEDNSTADVLLIAAALVSWTFTLLYGTRSRWRLLNAGRSLLYVYLALSIVLTQNAASVFLGTGYPGRGVVRLLMYLCLVVALCGMVRTLWKIQRSEYRTQCPRAERYVEPSEESL